LLAPGEQAFFEGGERTFVNLAIDCFHEVVAGTVR
jgi:hypothetical protein